MENIWENNNSKNMIKHIFYCPFTGKGLYQGFRGQDWYNLRADIFEKYVIPSLKNQTKKNFGLWVSFRPEEKENPTTKKIEKALQESGLEYIMTFNGIMMTDDRGVEHNVDLEERLEKTLPEVSKLVGDADFVYETNLDSDDLVHGTFSEVVQGKEFEPGGALYMKDGYAYNIKDRLAEWHNPYANQNYTIMFPKDYYLSAKDRLIYLHGLKTHEEVPTRFSSEELPSGLYCAIIHGTNISTVWGHPFMGKEIYNEDEKDFILKNFGIINN
jgi:hypothetical protein